MWAQLNVNDMLRELCAKHEYYAWLIIKYSKYNLSCVLWANITNFVHYSLSNKSDSELSLHSYHSIKAFLRPKNTLFFITIRLQKSSLLKVRYKEIVKIYANEAQGLRGEVNWRFNKKEVSINGEKKDERVSECYSHSI
jgi:hypothetical protein